MKPEDVPPSLNAIPNTYSEAHFCRCSHMPHVEMTLQGINRFYGGYGTCKPYASSASVSATLPKGYTAILINFTV